MADVPGQGGRIAPTYLGDGVYASFDGFHIWLHLEAHDAPRVVAIDPEVFAALRGYARRVNAHYGVHHFPEDDP